MMRYIFIGLTALFAVTSVAFDDIGDNNSYIINYHQTIDRFEKSQLSLLAFIDSSKFDKEGIEAIKERIHLARLNLKSADFWFRYLEPTIYKQMNGPLPVEWETEVFEKFEKPYKREGAGLTLAELYLDEENIDKDSLKRLLQRSVSAVQAYKADSISGNLRSYHHFFLCNRLYLLNLAAIYTTGFECPDTKQVIPELRIMMKRINAIYRSFNQSYTHTQLPYEFLKLYEDAINFVSTQPADYALFDHFSFMKDYINPLYLQNQKLINKYNAVSRSLIDYSLNKDEVFIFNKALYDGQNSKGIFNRVKDEEGLAEIDKVGKLLFYDPILSGNNQRSCASCHKPTEFFTDTVAATAFSYNHKDFLPRNTPTLINAQYNHLIMQDGKHILLQDQTKGVITSAAEMGSTEKEVLEKVLSCKEYKEAFTKLLKYTPQEKKITFDHIASAITFYYSRFSKYYSPFDEAINDNKPLAASAKKGFNLFMSKAQCATCHFVPQFNGVKPPYIGSEFEVLGVPGDTAFKRISADKGRHDVNPAIETMSAFRTGTVRNAARTAPYMHNGVFKTMDQVIEFYNNGGGAGRGLNVPNQTLSSDSLKLSRQEKEDLLAFVNALNEKVVFETAPDTLPLSKRKILNNRKPGGAY